MVPSFALRFTFPLRCAFACPEIPIDDFMVASDAMFARMAESGIASMSPAPKKGVGIRKIMFGFPPLPVTGFPAGRKSGWAMLQPGASVRPVITKRSCTSPSLAPSGLRLNRASRIGPLCVMNQGTVFSRRSRSQLPLPDFAPGSIRRHSAARGRRGIGSS